MRNRPARNRHLIHSDSLAGNTLGIPECIKQESKGDETLENKVTRPRGGRKGVPNDDVRIGMIGCAIAYLVPLILLIVILVKVNRIAKNQDRSLPRS
jgi:hypothetical protein